MALDKQLLDILVCPKCRGGLALVEAGQALLCDGCKLKYPILNDIPVMLVDRAQSLRKGDAEGVPSTERLPKLTFRVTQGSDAGLAFQLERGTCKAIGRGAADPQKTTMFNVDLALSLDEGTKSLIMAYIGKQFRRSEAGRSQAGTGGGERFGNFRRMPDLILTDSNLSRLHAMLFSDMSGMVGILDLVSKNGTYVNGSEVESRLLEKGDVIEVGETKVVFEG